jgi:hypothetical protein
MSTLQAAFERISEARQAIEALAGMGYTNAHLDAADNFRTEFSSELSQPGKRRIPSLSGLVLKSRGHMYGIDKASLLAVDPMVSGLGSCRDFADSNTRILVKVDDDKIDEVKKVIGEYGGIV